MGTIPPPVLDLTPKQKAASEAAALAAGPQWRLNIHPITGQDFRESYATEGDAVARVTAIFKSGFVAETGTDTAGNRWTRYHSLQRIQFIEITKL